MENLESTAEGANVDEQEQASEKPASAPEAAKPSPITCKNADIRSFLENISKSGKLEFGGGKIVLERNKMGATFLCYATTCEPLPSFNGPAKTGRVITALEFDNKDASILNGLKLISTDSNRTVSIVSFRFSSGGALRLTRISTSEVRVEVSKDITIRIPQPTKEDKNAVATITPLSAN